MRISGESAETRAGLAPGIRRDPLFLEERPVGRVLALLRRGPGRRPHLTPDVAFLSRHGIPENVLNLAARLAASRGTEPRQELFAIGFDRQRYWALLARDLGLPFAVSLEGVTLLARADSATAEAVRLASSLLVNVQGNVVLVIAPQGDDLMLLKKRLQATPVLRNRIRIAAPETIRAFLVARRNNALANYAVNRLARTLPRLSARRLRDRRRKGPFALFAALLGLGLLSPVAVMQAVAFLATLFFVNCSVWKLAAALHRPRPFHLEALPSDRLPTYTVLVPLYHEGAIVPDLVRQLSMLDYPASKLQLLLVVEADDAKTRAAVARHARSPLIEVISVPPRGPRTKPKALTYALPFARGDVVVVFDAEDRPEPDQLRKAAAAFHEHPGLGCVQARLQPDNQGSWIARMFALEYAANFEILLPALASWRVPLPLGGTSNHFPRAVLERVGAWDPFNVTEDADLGVRLTRFGYRSATILSRTYEEAPIAFRQWLPQRRRWIKGWMQTALLCAPGGVPAALRLSLRGNLAVHGIITAGVLGLLLYPFWLVAISVTALSLLRGDWPVGIWAWLFLGLNGNLAIILVAAVISTYRGLMAVNALHLARLLLFLPFYWGLMSIAAWQALFQLSKNPSGWEKTTHGVACDRRTPQVPAPLL